MKAGRDKSIVEMRLFDGLRYRQIADLMGISQEAVRCIIKRSYQVMRWTMERHARIEKVKHARWVEPKKDVITLADLSIRCQNALRAVNINDFEDLAKLTEREFLKIPHVGRKSAQEIISLMRYRGISFR
jgi:DNA-directed RNA polymerase alpha subunit